MNIEDREAEYIIQRHYNRKQKCFYYKVKWINYLLSQSTWETRDTLDHFTDMIDKFDAKLDCTNQRGNHSPIAQRSSPRKRPAKQIINPPVQKRGRGRTCKDREEDKDKPYPIQIDSTSPSKQKVPSHADHSPPKRQRSRPRKVQKSMINKKPEISSKNNQTKIRVHPLLVGRHPHKQGSKFLVLFAKVLNGKSGFMTRYYGKRKWMSRQQIIFSHPLSLVDYYQTRCQEIKRLLENAPRILRTNDDYGDDDDDELDILEELVVESSSLEDDDDPDDGSDVGVDEVSEVGEVEKVDVAVQVAMEDMEDEVEAVEVVKVVEVLDVDSPNEKRYPSRSRSGKRK